STGPTTTTVAPTTTTAPPPAITAPPAAPLPVATHRLTKLRFTIDSTAPWATIDLFGGSLGSQSDPVVTGGVGAAYSTTGFFLQTPSSGRLVVDAVYDLPASALEL